jgi:DNA-binding PadR family transcriptional regulator
MNKELLKRLLIVSKAMDAPPMEPSERAKELFEAALARRQPVKVLSEKQMKVVILKILSKGRADGGEIIEKLHELKVWLDLKGEGVIFALLARMEEDDLLSGKFDDAMVRKTYRMEERGSKLLDANSDSVRVISEPLAMLWST